MQRKTKCFDCQEREPGCHSSCEHYAQLQEDLKEERDAKEKEWKERDTYFNYKKDSYFNYVRKKGKRP